MRDLLLERVCVLIGDAIELTIVIELLGLIPILVGKVTILALQHFIVFTQHFRLFIRLLLRCNQFV